MKSAFVLPTISVFLIPFCNDFILLVMPGQMVGQCVKKKSATTIFPSMSDQETFCPNWLVKLKSGILCQMVSLYSLPFFVRVTTESGIKCRGMGAADSVAFFK